MPFINWRYILFTHNDSDEEMDLARKMAEDIGVDRLCWELTDHPEEMFSRRFLARDAELDAISHEIWDANNLGNAIPGATPRAEITVGGTLPGLPLIARRRGRKTTVKHACRNASTSPFPGAGQLRPATGAPRRAAVRRVGTGDQPGLRARLAAGTLPARRASRMWR